jgi:glycosyltransferase involved in cell wall biosynthesis
MVDGETGFLSEEADFKGMADNIEKLIVDPELRKKMAVNARKFVVEHYSLENSKEKFRIIYANLGN